MELRQLVALSGRRRRASLHASGGARASHAIEPVELGSRARARTWERPVRPQHAPGRADRGRSRAASGCPAQPSQRPRTAGTRSRRSAGWCAGIWRSAPSSRLGRVNLPGLVARFHRRHPAVTLRIHHVGAPELVRRTADGEIDLAIVDQPLGPQGNRVRARTIETEALQLAVAADDPIARRRRVRLSGLDDREFVEYRPDSALRASIDRACHAVGSAPSHRVRSRRPPAPARARDARHRRVVTAARRDPDDRRARDRGRHRPIYSTRTGPRDPT